MFSQSCMSNASIEDVGRASTGPKMLQAYCFRDRALTGEFLERARAAGFSALCLTFDVPVPGMRERDLLHGLTVPPRIGLDSLAEFATHPGWSLRYLRGPKLTLGNVAHRISAMSNDLSSVIEFVGQQFDPAATWADLVIGPRGRSALESMVARIRHRARVYDDWGFAAASSRGRGVSALFAGPSGTGKTMAFILPTLLVLLSLRTL